MVGRASIISHLGFAFLFFVIFQICSFIVKSLGYERGKYNQVANYAFLDAQINKSIRKKAPTVYFQEALAQCDTGIITCGSITDRDALMKNLQMNCIPLEIFGMDESRYDEFLKKRRVLMAQKIRKHYESL